MDGRMDRWMGMVDGWECGFGMSTYACLKILNTAFYKYFSEAIDFAFKIKDHIQYKKAHGNGMNAAYKQ